MLSLIFKRTYAKAAPQASQTLPALPPFTPSKAPLKRLPNMRGIPTSAIGLAAHPYSHRQPQTLLRAIDYENRLRYDSDGRSKLFDLDNPERFSVLI
jgi:hypothetical protein